MEISLKEKLAILIRGKYPHWVHSGDVEVFAQNEGYKASHGDRRARDLVAEKKIERVKEGVSVKYRWKPSQIILPPPFKVKEKEPARLL